MNKEDININTILLGVLIVLTGINMYMVSSNGSDIDLSPATNNNTNTAAAGKSSNINPNEVRPQQPNNNPMTQQANTNQQPQQTPINTQPQKPPTSMKFAQYQHDFGSVKPNTENKKIFTFTNTGDAPLFIQNAKGSCGCTVPTFPKEPINPNETGEIEVVFKPKENQVGPQTKTVTVTANTPEKNTVLTIKANVEK